MNFHIRNPVPRAFGNTALKLGNIFIGISSVASVYAAQSPAVSVPRPVWSAEVLGGTVLARGLQFAAGDRVGTAVAEVIVGPSGAIVVARAVIISTVGCNNGLILAGARVYYAMAKDGLFFRSVGAVNTSCALRSSKCSCCATSRNTAGQGWL